MPKYYMPTVLLSGKNCIKRHPRHLVHGKKCIIVTGANSAKVSGAIDDVTAVLDDENVDYEVFDKICADTNIGEIYALAQKIKSKGIEYIVGIGGGTVLDATKAAAVYAANDIKPMQIYEGNYKNAPLKVVCVPTTAGTGSDTTQYVMLTIDKPENKKSFSSELCFPYATYLDTRYTMTLPLDVTRNTAIDALCHAIESYLNTKASEFSDMVALRAISLIGECTKSLVSGKLTESDREKLLIAASSGGMAVAHTGLNIVHHMGFNLTCSKNIPHGRANGALLVEFIAFMAKSNIMRAVKVIDAFGLELTAFKRFINAVAPVNEVITETDIDEWAKEPLREDIYNNCLCDITCEDIKNIYYNALLNKERDYKTW